MKVFESQSGIYTGRTDLAVKRRGDGSPENGLGDGWTIEEALENTIKNFNDILKKDDFSELTEDDIEYSEWSDF